MNVNISVVNALMQLTGIPMTTLAAVCHVSNRDMKAWLTEESDNESVKIDFAAQLEILKYLGVNGNHPRSDVVHYWRIHEGLFSRPSESYWPLQVLLRTFGKAQASFITREADPAFSFTAKNHFGLRFDNFLAIVEVTAHPLRNISFDPRLISELTWVPDMMGVLLPEHELASLEPGSLKVRTLTQYLTYTAELVSWDKLRDAAMERGLRAAQVETLMLGSSANSGVAPATPELAVQKDVLSDSVPYSFEEEETDFEQPEPAAPVFEKPAPTQVPKPAAAPRRAAPQAHVPVSFRAPAEAQAPQDDLQLFVRPVKAAVKQAVAPQLKRVV